MVHLQMSCVWEKVQFQPKENLSAYEYGFKSIHALIVAETSISFEDQEEMQSWRRWRRSVLLPLEHVHGVGILLEESDFL